MKDNSRIRFNPVTKDIEVEGTEQFVKTYFGKLQAIISGVGEKNAAIRKEPKPVKAAPAKGDKKIPKVAKVRPQKKAKKSAKKAPGKKKITNQASVIELIQGSREGISTAELIKKTGLAERQIWSIAYRAAKEGKIRKIKRGAYGAVAAS
jgi:hypothetical protein